MPLSRNGSTSVKKCHQKSTLSEISYVYKCFHQKVLRIDFTSQILQVEKHLLFKNRAIFLLKDIVHTTTTDNHNNWMLPAADLRGWGQRVRPLPGSLLFIYMQFSGKVRKIIGCPASISKKSWIHHWLPRATSNCVNEPID